jgi:vacuolar protein sorting-associated protein IST1
VPPNDAGNIATETNGGKFSAGVGEGTPKLPDIPPTEDDDEKGGSESAPSKQLDDFAMLAKRFEALKKR